LTDKDLQLFVETEQVSIQDIHLYNNNFRPSLIEEIALFPSDVYIEKIFIVRVNEGARSGPGKKTHKKPKLIVLTKDQVCLTWGRPLMTSHLKGQGQFVCCSSKCHNSEEVFKIVNHSITSFMNVR